MTTPISVPTVEIPVLYEDEVLIVVDKPAGIPTQMTLDKKRPHVYGLLQAQMRKKNPESYLALHHRLDKDTSGVLLFCKDRGFNTQIGEMFKHHEFEKVYWAITEKGPCPEKWQVKNYLTEKPGPRSQRMKMHSVRAGGLIAITDFKKLDILEKGLLVEARPRTGRMHQIRVHLAEAGLPILGDDLYNPSFKKGLGVPHMMLHAYQLTFTHPQTQEVLTITSQPPEEFQKR